MNITVGKEITDENLVDLRSSFPDVIFSSVVAEPEAISEADAYIGRIAAEDYYRSGERLRWVHSTGAGIETIIAIPELVASDIVVTNTRGAHAPFVAEHTFALILSLNRYLSKYAQDQREHHFHAYGRGVPMESLYGKRMLILGMGNIGTAIARRALAFEMDVVGLDLRIPEQLGGEYPILSMTHLDEELKTADVLVVTVPLTAETENLIDARRISELKPGAMVIGISRGKIINEAALAARLREGTLGGAGLDVYAEEPLPPDHFLWETPRLVMTPHCAPTSPDTRKREFEITRENIRRFVEGEPLLNVCDKVAGF
ncbi:MAG TPA: D-2-hydroxyacid dehydrogenase [Thermomicrobiales bacterium]|nr:D-2-hydroxyacid dehydrogenase [Thermomicrobiales bacterium]